MTVKGEESQFVSVGEPSAQGLKEGYLVLGMHRSGTSAVAGMIAKLGITPPATLLPPADDNIKGFWESAKVVALNDEILASAGSHWNDWREFNPRWLGTAAAAGFRARAAELILEEYPDASAFVLKDPRICRFPAFWLDVLADLGVRPRVLIPVRSPLEVARSLQARDGQSLGRNLLVWLRHVLDAEHGTRDIPRAVVNWPNLLRDWRIEARRMEGRLGTTWPRWSDQAAVDIDDFLSADLYHQRVPDEQLQLHPGIHAWVSQAYEALLALAADPQSNWARATLDDIRLKLGDAGALMGEPFAALEHSEKSLTEALNDLGRRHDALAREQARAAADLTHARQELQEATGERDSLAERLRLAQEKSESLQQGMAAERQELSAVIERLTAEQDNLLKQYKAAYAERDTAVHQRNMAAQQTRALQEKLKAMEGDLERHAQSIAALEDMHQRVAGEVEKLRAERSDLVRRADAAGQEYEWRKTQFEAEMEQLVTAIEGLTAEKDSLSQRQGALAAERDAAAHQRDQLAEQVNERQARLDAFQRDIDTLRAERDDLVRRADDAGREYKRLKTEFEAEIKQLATAIESVTAEKDSLTERHGALAAERDTAVHQRNLQAEQVNERQARLDALQRDIDALRAEVEAKKHEEETKPVRPRPSRLARSLRATLGLLTGKRGAAG